jgi:hypothetical protein
MSHSIFAIFDSGVFRPLEPVDLAEGTRAEVIPVSQPARPSEVPIGRLAWPADYFARMAGALSDEPFERPPQGEMPMRESW